MVTYWLRTFQRWKNCAESICAGSMNLVSSTGNRTCNLWCTPLYLATQTHTTVWCQFSHQPWPECHLKTYVWNFRYTLPQIWGPKKHLFSTTSQLKRSTSLEWNTIYTIRKVCWKLQGVSYITSKSYKCRSTKGLKLDRSSYQPSVNSGFCFTATLRTSLGTPGLLCKLGWEG